MYSNEFNLLFNLVDIYFKYLNSSSLTLFHNHVDDISSKLIALYKKPIIIKSYPSLSQMYLHNILLDAASCHDLSEIKDKMLGLAMWLTFYSPLGDKEVLNGNNNLVCLNHINTYGIVSYFVDMVIKDYYKNIDDLLKTNVDSLKNMVCASSVDYNLVVHEIISFFKNYDKCITKNPEKEFTYLQTEFNGLCIKFTQRLIEYEFFNTYNRTQSKPIKNYFNLIFPSLDEVPIIPNALNWYVMSSCRTHLIDLELSANFYRNEKKLMNFNDIRGCRYFDSSEYSLMMRFSDKEIFDVLPERLPNVSVNSYLKQSELDAVFKFVNEGFYPDALIDNYDFTIVNEPQYVSYVELNIIYIVVKENVLSYQVRDRREKDLVHQGEIHLKDLSSKYLGLNDPASQLEVIQYLTKMKHAFPNYKHSNDSNFAEAAYLEFFNFYVQLDKESQERLNSRQISVGHQVQTFGEVWQHGNPECLATAGKYFVSMLIDFFPDIRFDDRIEKNKNFEIFLKKKRRIIPNIYESINMILPEDRPMEKSLQQVNVIDNLPNFSYFFMFTPPEKRRNSASFSSSNTTSESGSRSSTEGNLEDYFSKSLLLFKGVLSATTTASNSPSKSSPRNNELSDLDDFKLPSAAYKSS